MKIAFIKHQDLDEENLSEIIILKNQHWNYSTQQHIDWMAKNLTEDDCHLLLCDDDNNLIAYLNFINLFITGEDRTELSAIGIGNVCVDKLLEKKGLGLLLMQVANYYIKNKKKQGLLLCKDSLVTFYKKAGWVLYTGEVFIQDNKKQGALMILFPVFDNLLSIDKNF